MIDDGLVRYIKERLGEGYNESQIRDVLAQHGHSAQSVDAAFRMIHRLHAPRILPFLLVLLLLVAVVVFLLLRQDFHAAPPITAPSKQNTTVPTTGSTSPGAVGVAEQLLKERQNRTADETYYATVQVALETGGTVGDGILICSANEQTTYKNYCLQQLAEQQKNGAYCEVIGDTKQRDDCYILVILKGEDQYCDKLVLDENKRVCAMLLGTA